MINSPEGIFMAPGIETRLLLIYDGGIHKHVMDNGAAFHPHDAIRPDFDFPLVANVTNKSAIDRYQSF